MTTTTAPCPDCGARNPAGADWCGQCYVSLRPEPEPEPTPPPPAAADIVQPAPSPDTAPSTHPAPQTPPPPTGAPTDSVPAPLASGDGRFRRTGDLVEWSCDTCGTWNDTARLTCAACGTPFVGRDATSSGVPDDVDPKEVRLASFLLPGGGQWLLGQKGRAVGRILIGSLWLLGGLVLIVSAVGSGALAYVPGAVLLVGCATIWGLSALDVRTILAGGSREILDDRLFLWLVVGVLGTVIASLLLAALPAAG